MLGRPQCRGLRSGFAVSAGHLQWGRVWQSIAASCALCGAFHCGGLLSPLMHVRMHGAVRADLQPTQHSTAGALSCPGQVVQLSGACRSRPASMQRAAVHAQAPVEKIPWGLLLSKPAVWALIICHFCHNWGTFILLTWMPSYYNQVCAAPCPRLVLHPGPRLVLHHAGLAPPGTLMRAGAAGPPCKHVSGTLVPCHEAAAAQKKQVQEPILSVG